MHTYRCLGGYGGHALCRSGVERWWSDDAAGFQGSDAEAQGLYGGQGVRPSNIRCVGCVRTLRARCVSICSVVLVFASVFVLLYWKAPVRQGYVVPEPHPHCLQPAYTTDLLREHIHSAYIAV